ncbi:MAG: DUF5688 family protein [Eubacterium sp.]
MKAIQFYTNLTETLKENLGTDWTIELHTDVILNNGTTHIALILYKNGEKLHPQIYLERFFEDYKRGKTMKEILQDVMTTYEEALKNINPDSLSGIEDWEQVKGRLAFRLLSKERNKETLENYVYQEFLDLAAIVTFCAEIDEQGVKAIRVTHDLAERWNVSEEEILQATEENTEALFPVRMEPILDTLCRVADISRDDLPEEVLAEEDSPQIMVLTNYLGVNGATVLLYDSLLKQIYEKLGGKFIILPSSIHEVIVMPLASAPPITDSQKMVEQINRSAVKEEEILSDSVYLYDGEKVILACDSKGVCAYEENLD